MESSRKQVTDYRDLVVWQEAMELAVLAYQVTKTLPKEEAYGMTSQIRRSASSIPANIAEGFGRQQRKSFIQFLRIAQGSLKELESHTYLAGRVELMGLEQVNSIIDRSNLLGKRLVSFVRSLESSAGPE